MAYGRWLLRKLVACCRCYSTFSVAYSLERRALLTMSPLRWLFVTFPEEIP